MRDQESGQRVRWWRPRLAVAILTTIAVATWGWVTVGAEPTGYRLTDAGVGTAAGSSEGGEFGLTAAAGQTALGEAKGSTIGLSTGAVVRPDACPLVSGIDARQGCELALEAKAAMHVIDQAKSGECRRLVGADASTCSVPLEKGRIKVFDRNQLNGLTITARDGVTKIRLSKNPEGQLYDDVYESSEANAMA